MLYRDDNAATNGIGQKSVYAAVGERFRKEVGIKSDLDDKDVKLFALDTPFGKSAIADLYKAKNADQLEDLILKLISHAYDTSPSFKDAVHKSNLGQIPDPEKLKAAIATSPITQSVKALIKHFEHKTGIFYNSNEAPRLVSQLVKAIREETEAPFGTTPKEIAPLSADDLKGFNLLEKDIVPEISEKEVKKAIAYFLGKDIEGHIDAESKFVKNFKNKYSMNLTEDQKKDRIYRFLNMIKTKKPDSVYLKDDLRSKASEYYKEISDLTESVEVLPDDKLKLLFGVTNEDLKSIDEHKAADRIAYYLGRKIDNEGGIRKVTRLPKGGNEDHIDAIAELSTVEQMKILHSFLEQLKAERDKANFKDKWLDGDLNKLTQSFIKGLIVEEKPKIKERDTQLIRQDSERMIEMVDNIEDLMYNENFSKEGKIIGDIAINGVPTDEETSPYFEKIKKAYDELKMPEDFKRRILKSDTEHLSYTPINEATIKTELDEERTIPHEKKSEIDKKLKHYKDLLEKKINLSEEQQKEYDALLSEYKDADSRLNKIKNQEDRLLKLVSDPGVKKLSDEVDSYISFLGKKKQLIDGLLKFKDVKTVDAMIERFSKFAKEFNRAIVDNATVATLLKHGHPIFEFPKGVEENQPPSEADKSRGVSHSQFKYKELDKAQLKGKRDSEIESLEKSHEAMYHPLVKYFGENKYLEKIKKVLKLIVDGKTLSHMEVEEITTMINQMKDRIEDIKKIMYQYNPSKLHTVLVKKLRDKANLEKVVKPKKEKKANVSTLIRKMALKLREKEQPNWMVYGEKYKPVGGEAKKQYIKSFFDKPDYVNSFVDALASRGFKFFSGKGEEISDPTQYDPKIDDIVGEVLLKGTKNIEDKILNKVGTDRILEDKMKDAKEEVERGNEALQKYEASIVKAKDQYLPKLEAFAKFFNRPDDTLAEAAKAQGLTKEYEELTMKKKPDLGKEEGLKQLQEAIVKKDISKIKEYVTLKKKDDQDPKKTVDDEADIMNATFKPQGQEQTDPLAKKVIKELSERFNEEWKEDIGEKKPDREKVREEMSEKERGLATIYDRNFMKKTLIKFFDNYVDYKKKLPEGLKREDMVPVQDLIKDFLSGPSKTVVDRGLTPEEMDNRNRELEALKAEHEKMQKTFTYLRSKEHLNENDMAAFNKLNISISENEKAIEKSLSELNETLKKTKEVFKADINTYREAVNLINKNKDDFKSDSDFKEYASKAKDITEAIKSYKEDLDTLVKNYDNAKNTYEKAKEELKRIRVTLYGKGEEDKTKPLSEKEIGLPGDKKLTFKEEFHNSLLGINKAIDLAIYNKEKLQRELDGIKTMKTPPPNKIEALSKENEEIAKEFSDLMDKKIDLIKKSIPEFENKKQELTKKKIELQKDPTKSKDVKDLEIEIQSIEFQIGPLKNYMFTVDKEDLKNIEKYMIWRKKQRSMKTASGAEDMGGAGPSSTHDIITDTAEMPMQKVGPKGMPEYKKVELQTQMPEPKVKDWEVVQFLFGKERANASKEISKLREGLGDIADVEVLKEIVNEINRKQNEIEKRGKLLDLKVKIGDKSVAVKDAGKDFKELLEEYQNAVNGPLIKRNNLIPKVEKARSRLKSVDYYVDSETGKFREFNKDEKAMFVRLFYKQLFWDLMSYWKRKVGKNALFGGREMAPFSKVFDTFKNIAGVKSNPVISGQLNLIANEFKAKDSTYTKSRFTELKNNIKDLEKGMSLSTKGSAKYEEFEKEKAEKEKELEHLSHLKKQKDILMRKMMDTADTGFLISTLAAINKKIGEDNAKETEMVEAKKKELEEKKGETFDIVKEIQPEPIGKAPTKPELKMKAPKLDFETLKSRISENLSYSQINKLHEKVSEYTDSQKKEVITPSAQEKAKDTLLTSIGKILKDNDMDKTFEQYKDTISGNPEKFKKIMDDLFKTEEDVSDSISKVVEDIPDPDKAIKSINKALTQIANAGEGEAKEKLVGQLLSKIEDLFDSAEQSYTFKKVEEMVKKDPTLFVTQLKKRLEKMEEVTKKEAYYHDKNFIPTILYGKKMQSVIASLLRKTLYGTKENSVEA